MKAKRKPRRPVPKGRRNPTAEQKKAQSRKKVAMWLAALVIPGLPPF